MIPESENLKRAEDSVDANAHVFEQAMDHLEEKIAGTAAEVQEMLGKIENTVAMIKEPLDKFQEALDKTQQTTLRLYDQTRSAAQEGMKRAREFYNETEERVRENPRPYLIGALTGLAVLGGIGLAWYYRSHRKSF